MGNMYRILIESGDGETVAELMAPAEMLAQFAPEAVARLLREAAPEAEGDTPENRDYLVGATDQPPQQRRRRRTKAEMEAARAAEAGAPASDPLHTSEDQAAPAPADGHMAGGGRGPEPEKYNPFG